MITSLYIPQIFFSENFYSYFFYTTELCLRFQRKEIKGKEWRFGEIFS